MNKLALSRRHFLGAAGSLAAVQAFGSGARAQAREPLVFIGWSHTEAGSKPFLEKTFDGFRSANANVNFEVLGVPFGQMETSLLLRKRSNQRTDIAQLQERWLAPFVAAGGVADVDQLFGKDFIDKTYHPAALAMTKVGDKRYGLPWVTGSTGLVSHAKVLADAGVGEMPKSIDAFIDALRKVKKAKPASSPMGLSTKNPSLIQLESQLFFWTFGGRFFDGDKVAANSDANRKALTLLADMVKEGLVLPGNDRFDIRRLYAQELVAFYPDPPLARAFARAQSGQGEAYDKNVVPVAMPVVSPSDTPVSVQWGHLLGFLDYGGARPGRDTAAARFANYVSQPDVQIAYYKETGVFPSTIAAIDRLKDDSYLQKWIDLSRTARPDELTPFSNANELRTVIGEEVAAAMLAQKTPADALKSMSDRLTSIGPKR